MVLTSSLGDTLNLKKDRARQITLNDPVADTTEEPKPTGVGPKAEPAFGLLRGKADADLGTPLGRVSPNQPCNDLGSCLLDDVEAFDRLQRQLLRLRLVVHHPLDNEASKKMPHAMGRQR
jgi:hypothetical protein